MFWFFLAGLPLCFFAGTYALEYHARFLKKEYRYLFKSQKTIDDKTVLLNHIKEDWKKDYDEEFDEEKYKKKFNKMPRTLRNGDICLPFTTQCVVKSIDNYQEKKSTIDAVMTMYVRVKLTGLPNKDELMKHIQDNLKICVNEEITHINEDKKNIKVHKFVSVDSQDNSHDVISLKLAYKIEMQADSEKFAPYPFEKPPFKMVYCVHGIKMDDQTYHFDHYKCAKPLEFKPNVDRIPEFDVDYKSNLQSQVKTLRKKVYFQGKDGKLVHDDYYPKV